MGFEKCSLNYLRVKNPFPVQDAIEFDDGHHIYTVDGKPRIVSCTSFIGYFKNKFDADATIAKYYDKWQRDPTSKYHGMSRDDIRVEWKMNGKRASSFGTRMHEHAERFYNNPLMYRNWDASRDYYAALAEGAETDDDRAEMEHMVQFLDMMPEAMRSWEPLRTELRIHSPEHDVTGSVDMIYKDPHGAPDGKDVIVADWKWSRKIPRQAFGNQRCKYVLQDQEDCKFNHYVWQLSVYAEMIERQTGYRVTALYLGSMHPECPERFQKVERARDVVRRMLAFRLDHMDEMNAWAQQQRELQAKEEKEMERLMRKRKRDHAAAAAAAAATTAVGPGGEPMSTKKTKLTK